MQWHSRGGGQTERRESGVEFRVLGPVQVLDGQQVIPVPTGKVREVLAVLLLRANQVVTVAELVDRIWGESPPAHPRGAVQTYIGRLRQATDELLIQTRPQGYLLELDPARLDLTRFRHLVEQAAQAGGPAEQAELLSQALDLWRGRPLADVTSEALLREEVPRLQEEYLHALGRLLDARLQLGEHARVVAQLTSLTRRYPLQERFWGQLMLALYRCGRQADALRAYHTISQLLGDELGIDPSEELQHLHQAILAMDTRIAAPPVETTSREQPWITQCQLPLDVGDFIGRDDVTAEILDLIHTSISGPGVLIAAISGPPGVGKSALAIRVAHAARHGFPDGQWFLRLNGAGGNPRSPAELLDSLLRSAGVEPAMIPADVPSRATLYRSRVADRRLLVVLDDAADAGQVEPLLPGTSSCTVIVTSRCDLGRLTATHGARRRTVSGLAPPEAHELLVRMLGPDRVHAEPGAAGEIARLCSELPLALRIAAANLAGRPHTSLARYATELGGTDRLDKLACTDDPQVAVRAAFAVSYAVLDAPLQRAFRLLGLIPGPDFDRYATAVLLGVSEPDAEERLDRLTAANLIERRGTSRYGLHDLIRLYAAERAATDEPAAARDSAWHRLLHWYLHTANAAITARQAMATSPGLPDPGDGIRPRSFGTDQEALAWLDEERANLVATISSTADSDHAGHAWLLTGLLRGYFDSRRHFDEWSAALSAALRGADRADPIDQIRLHNDQGVLHWRQGRHPDATTSFEFALAVGAESGVRDVEGRILNNLGAMHNEMSMLTEATHYLDRALDSQQNFAAEDHFNRSIVLANLGAVYSNLGRFESAVRSTSESLVIAQRDGTRGWYCEALAHEVLGDAYLWLDEPGLAHEHLSRALDIFHDAGLRAEEGYLLEMISAVHRATGQHTLALEYGHTSLDIFEEIGSRRFMANAHNSIGASLHGLNHPEPAFEHFSTAYDLAHETDYLKGRIVALTGLATAGHEIDGDAGYARYAEEAATLAGKARHTMLEGRALDALALIRLADGRHAEAAAHAERAITIHRRTGCRAMLADALVVRGKARAGLGDNRSKHSW